MKKCIFIISGVILMVVVAIVSINIFSDKRKCIALSEKSEIIKEQIVEDVFSSGTAIERTIAEKVEVTVENVEDGKVNIKVSAPDISKDLFEWIEGQEDVSDEKLEDKIIELIDKGESVETEYILDYLGNDEVEISYTQESRNAMTCGLLEFYYMCMQNAIEDMKGDM